MLGFKLKNNMIECQDNLNHLQINIYTTKAIYDKLE